MNNPMKIKTVKIEQLLNDDWQERSAEERRSDNENRNGQDKSYFQNGGREGRKEKERRHAEERRDGLLRVGQWRMESVFENKI